MRKSQLLLVFMLLTVMQVLAQKNITGRVTSSNDGKGLSGVSVMVKGTSQGVYTDNDGRYSLNVTEGKTLVFTYVGMKTQELNVTSATTIMEIVLESEASVENVVVIGYGSVRKSDLTGSVGKVNVADLKKVTSIDAARALQGRVAGVNVMSNSGNPGAGVKIRVRGIGTINNSDPLFVVDGFPMSDMSHVAPNDIESMEVLKDASATAIYGSRGANGVILVKTRSGSKGKKLEVLANYQLGVSQVSKKLELANATEFANARKAIGATDDIINYVLDQQAAGNVLKGTDWQKEIYRPDATFSKYNLSILGSTENYSYDQGITYVTDEGTVKGTYLNKLMFHSNNNINLTKKVKIGLNFNYVHYERPGDRGDYYSGTLPGALRSDPISTAWDKYTNFYGEVYYSQAATNPALSIYLAGKEKYLGNRGIGNFYFQVDDLFVKGLAFRSQFGTQIDFDDQKSYSPKYFITPTQKNDDATLYQRRPFGVNWVNTNYFSYLKSVSKLNINATLGMELQASRWSDIWATGYDVPESADLQYLGAHKDAVKFALGGGASETRLASTFVRGNFSWDNKYALTATMRVDGSSKFTPEKRWGYFPSLAASWNLNREKFMANLTDILPTLKLRAGWGQVGNQSSAGNFDYVSTVNGGYIYALNGIPVEGAVQEQLANTELTWETAEQINAGVDFGLLKNKLTGTVDYFIRNTNNMILQRPIPMYAGKKKPAVNAGSMQNRGVEVSLNYANANRNFRYDVGVNLTFIKNEITSLAGGDPIRGGGAGRMGNATKTEVGREIAYFFGYKTAGIFKSKEQLDGHVFNGVPIQPNAGLGDVIFQDLNNDGKITELDMTYLGSASPKITGGFNLNLAYKAFDMVLFVNGSYGNELVNSMYQTLYSSKMFETNISRDMALNHWSDLNPTSNIPRLDAADLNKNTENFSDLYVEDGSYLRLKNLQFGYTLPTALSNRAKIKSLRIYASFDNLLTLTKYTGLDPELFGLYGDPFHYGVDMVNYPQPRVYSVGVNLTF